MPVDKFGRMSDLKTKDAGVSLTYINNNYVRSDGQTPLTGSLDMRGNTLYNVADPVNPQDVVTKVYVDNTKGSGVIGRKTKDGVSIKGNLDFLGKQRIKNLPAPVDPKDAVSREYVDTTTTPFLKLEQRYNAKGDIDMGGQFTVLNVKTPTDDNHIVDKKYVDEMDNLNSAFKYDNGLYYAKGELIMRKNKLGGLREPLRDGEAATKKYVDDKVKNHFIDVNDNIAFGLNVDMEGNQILGLPEPLTDQEPATKKYVDNLQNRNIDQKGNIKFERNIKLDNKRIIGMKAPTKPKEGANKEYVDNTITQRIQEEKDNFLPKDPATKHYVDEAIRGIAAGDVLVSKEGVFIKENGHYRATAPLDIDNQKMENIPDPVDDKDAVNKKYIDGIVENLTLKQGLVRENGGFNLVDSYINMNFNSVRNVGLPEHESDAVPRRFIDNEIRLVKKYIQNQFKELNQLVSVSGSFYGLLDLNDYPFTFGGPIFNDDFIVNNEKNILNKFNGFLVPANGVLKHFVTFSSSVVVTLPNTTIGELIGENFKPLIDLYGKPDTLVKLFSLIKIEEKGKEEEIVGEIFFKLSDLKHYGENYFTSIMEFKFILKEKFKNKEENFICSVNQGDIINIRSEYKEEKIEIHDKPNYVTIPIYNYYKPGKKKPVFDVFINSLHITTLTFLFKEMSFPNVLN